MSLLAPLYALGVLAIGLPIIFHLIRRSPQGRQDFSSLMFLTASPPALTRRSRLTNILLLILRAAALALLAFAFARPFFRHDADASANQPAARRIALLVDTSASMRRGDLWAQAARQAEQALADVTPGDEVALYFFDRRVRPGMTFAEWNEMEVSRRVPLLRARLAQEKPSFDSTRIGDAVANVADLVSASDSPREGGERTERQVVLISDMQRGGHAETLQRYEWPRNVTLGVRPVSVKETTNGSVQLVTESSTQPAGALGADGRLRVRISNEPGAAREQFTLSWANKNGPIPSIPPTKHYVAPGRSQMARVLMPSPDAGADRLVLGGDDFDFDNTLYLVPARKDAVRIVYLGDDAAEDTLGLRYYLHSAIGETDRRSVEFVARGAKAPLSEADLIDARLAVVTTPMSSDGARALGRYLDGGGSVLCVLRDAGAETGVSLARLSRVDNVQVKEARVREYALIARVDFDHPLFAPLADPRFSDFSKIRFWRYRSFAPDDRAKQRVLARFDSNDPFLIEQTIGRGRLWIMTAGWNPADSQLALSTKFVPLLEGMIRPQRDQVAIQAQYLVGDPVVLPKSASQHSPVIIGADGGRVEVAISAREFEGANQPGIYRLSAGGTESEFAVNLSSDESRTAPIAVEELEQWGVRLAQAPEKSAELVAQRHHLQTLELENRQKLWRWLIVGVLGLLAAETALAGRLARRSAEAPLASNQQVTT